MNMFKINPNPDNSSIMQVLLDIKAAGGPSRLVDEIIDIITVIPDTNKPSILQEAEEIYYRHQYPQRAIKFTKLSIRIEFARFLSHNALTILTAMYQNMWHRNMIQLTQRDIIKITSITSSRPIKDALKELIDKGCIAVVVKGTTRQPAIYMVNPEIATVGRDESNLRYTFWGYTGTDYTDFKHPKYSDPHKEWKRLTANRTYSISNASMVTDEKTITYNRIGEPKVKTEKKKPTKKAKQEQQEQQAKQENQVEQENQAEQMEQEQLEQQQMELLEQSEQQEELDIQEQMELLEQWDQME